MESNDSSVRNEAREGPRPGMPRRDVLKLALGSAVGALWPRPLLWRLASVGSGAAALGGHAGCAAGGAAASRAWPYTPVAPTRADAFVLAPELRVELLAVEGDPLALAAPSSGPALFGSGCDHLAFLPIDLHERGPDLAAPQRGFVAATCSSREGLLVVNHEALTPRLFHADWQAAAGVAKSAAQLAAEQHALGLSVVHVRRDDAGAWRVVEGSRFTRRVDANALLALRGPAATLDGGPRARGTFANCSGGRTPWGTVLSCEENFHEFASDDAEFEYRWPKEPYATRRHYGWVVEIDPFEPQSTPRKQTALGRFRHENVAVRVAADGTLACYMGDDRNDGFLYKFVAAGKVSGDRAKDRALLESGTLYVAQIDGWGAAGAGAVSSAPKRGRWLPLALAEQAALREAKGDDGQPLFANDGEVVAEAPVAAKRLGATPLERPEDSEIDPRDGSLFVALTNHKKKTPKDWHGRIVRLEEAGGDAAAREFVVGDFAVGGPDAGFSCPDNLAFDGNGDLWVTSDMTSEEIGGPEYGPRGNNGLFFFRTRGPQAGVAVQVASGPVDCELTGPCFTPDGTTLFLSVQHPGETSKSRAQLTSHWPRGGGELPRSAVVAITGFQHRA